MAEPQRAVDLDRFRALMHRKAPGVAWPFPPVQSVHAELLNDDMEWYVRARVRSMWEVDQFRRHPYFLQESAPYHDIDFAIPQDLVVGVLGPEGEPDEKPEPTTILIPVDIKELAMWLANDIESHDDNDEPEGGWTLEAMEGGLVSHAATLIGDRASDGRYDDDELYDRLVAKLTAIAKEADHG